MNKQHDAEAMPWDDAKEAEDTKDDAADDVTPSGASKATTATAAAARKAWFKKGSSKEDIAPAPTEIDWPTHKHMGYIENYYFPSLGYQEGRCIRRMGGYDSRRTGGTAATQPCHMHFEGG